MNIITQILFQAFGFSKTRYPFAYYGKLWPFRKVLREKVLKEDYARNGMLHTVCMLIQFPDELDPIEISGLEYSDTDNPVIYK